MKLRVRSLLWFMAAALALLAAGCGRSSAPPPPLAAGQIPAELRRVFDQSRPDFRASAGRIISALGTNDYVAAYLEAQQLCALPDETPEQRTAGARVLLGLTALLQTAQAQGDPMATEALKLHRTSR